MASYVMASWKKKHVAGYETTSAVLSYLAHLLAHNQNVQKRLSEEIEEKIGQDEPNLQPGFPTENKK
jgi:cytochrome P450